MGIWLMMLGFDLLCPVIMLIAGRWFIVKPPKKINGIVGYRTDMSMKNQDTWEFAHHYSGKFLWKWGKITLILSVIPILFLIEQSEELVATVGCIIMFLQMIPILGVIPPTEKALRDAFDKDGNRKIADQ